MEHNTKFVLKEFLSFVWYAIITIVLLLAMFWITHFDLVWSGGIPELSLTEILQEIIVLTCTGIFIFIARKYEKQGLWLVSGLLCCMFIRELDVVFDMVFHGAWKYIALPAAVFFIFLAVRKGITPVIEVLEQFMKKKNYPFLFLGLILILIVSRILGSLELVKLLPIRDDNIRYLVKNFMEESSELIGYFILFISSCCYLYEYYKEKKIKNPPEAELSGE